MTACARIAALPMYDADRGAVAAWWQAIAAACRDEGIDDVPDTLTWPTDLATHWRDPCLLLSQACGAPLVAGLADAVQVVGAFAYTADGCDGIDYRSRLMVRMADAGRTLADLRGRIAAVNDRGSHSGAVALNEALQTAIGPGVDIDRHFAATVVTGSHRASLQHVRSGASDIAAIDCVTLAGIQRTTPHALDGLTTIGWTPAAPGLPLITSATTSPQNLEALRRALTTACEVPHLEYLRSALLIDTFHPLTADTWLARAHPSSAHGSTAAGRSRIVGRSAHGT